MKNIEKKILNQAQASKISSQWKGEGNKIVFTNGCFDIIHLGHIDYLENARNLGDKLIVGLNTDRSVRLLKGSGRPINNLRTRSMILAAMFFVDVVMPFDEETPYNLIQQIKPDILVKGSDYSIQNIVGSDIVMENGGEVKTLDYLEGHSSTATIERIIKSLK
jgi:rfaE bifunctional protein nucleotidyltransferase chain/domain